MKHLRFKRGPSNFARGVLWHHILSLGCRKLLKNGPGIGKSAWYSANAFPLRLKESKKYRPKIILMFFVHFLVPCVFSHLAKERVKRILQRRTRFLLAAEIPF